MADLHLQAPSSLTSNATCIDNALALQGIPTGNMFASCSLLPCQEFQITLPLWDFTPIHMHSMDFLLGLFMTDDRLSSPTNIVSLLLTLLLSSFFLFLYLYLGL
jgi:hypothetical protein